MANFFFFNFYKYLIDWIIEIFIVFLNIHIHFNLAFKITCCFFRDKRGQSICVTANFYVNNLPTI